MSKKGKSRTISNVKRSNQKRNKLIKKGKLKPNSKPKYVPQNSTRKASYDPVRAERDRICQREAEETRLKDEKEARSQLIEELDPEEVEYIIANHESKALKRYENSSRGKVKNFLPIKTKDGIQARSTVEEDPEEEEIAEPEEEEKEKKEEAAPEEVSVIELVARRRELLAQKRITIGNYASGFLEDPQERLPLLEKLIKMTGEDMDPTIAVSGFRLASASILEIFKDVLPSYKIRDESAGHLKKETLKLHKYELALLACVKTFLVRLEQRLKNSDASSLHSLDLMGRLLVSHPHFNFSQNIVNVLTGYINHKNSEFRTCVFGHFKSIFKGDKRGEISLFIVRKLNSISKSKKTLYREVIEVLEFLPIKDINLDKMKDEEIQAEQTVKRNKKLLVKVSKKEKKRKKKMEKLENELLEAKGEESSKVRYRFYTEIVKLVFAIYFRILKNAVSGGRSPLLIYILKGLSKFSHAINIDFFQDLLTIFATLLKEDRDPSLNLMEHLHVIKTVFVVLSDQGEFLNIDPIRFYKCLYGKLNELNIVSGGSEVVISSLNDMLIKRKKKISAARTFAFSKRLATASTVVDEYATLGFTAFLRELFVARPELKTLLEIDEFGSGVYAPEVDEPENANAANTALWELQILKDHYSPRVGLLADHLLKFASSGSATQTLPKELRLPSEDILAAQKKYDPLSALPSKLVGKKRKCKMVFKEDEPNPAKRFRTERLEKWMKVLYSVPEIELCSVK